MCGRHFAQSGRGRKRKLAPIDQLGILLPYLTSGFTFRVIASSLLLSTSLVQRVIYTCLAAVDRKFESLFPHDTDPSSATSPSRVRGCRRLTSLHRSSSTAQPIGTFATIRFDSRTRKGPTNQVKQRTPGSHGSFGWQTKAPALMKTNNWGKPPSITPSFFPIWRSSVLYGRLYRTADCIGRSISSDGRLYRMVDCIGWSIVMDGRL
jgi:hypothetical protein